MANKGYSIKISALDAFTKPLQGMAKIVKSFATGSEKSLGKMADNATLNRAKLQALLAPLKKINTEIKRLGENSGLNNSFKNLGEGLKSIGKIGAGLGATFGGMVFISKQAAEHEALAKSVGISGKSLSAWGGLVSKAGFDTSHIIDLVEEMNNKFGELESLGELSSATDSLKMLNLSFEDMKKLKPEEQFKKIMQAAANLDNQQVAVSAVDMLLGGEANKILGLLRAESKATGKSIQELIKEKEKLNLGSNEGIEGNKKMAAESAKAFAVLKSGLAEIVGVLGHTLAPLIGKFRVWFINNFDDIKDNVKVFANYLKVIFTGTDKEIDELINTSSGFVSMFLKIVRAVGAGKLIFGTLAAVLGGPVLLGLGLVTFAFVKLGLAMMANPVVLIVMAIVAAIAGLVALVYYFKDSFIAAWESAKNAVIGFWEVAKEYFAAFWELLKKYHPYAIGFRLMMSLWDGLKSVWGDVAAWFSSVISELTSLMPDWLKEQMGISIKTEQNVNSIAEKNTRPAITANDIKDKFSLSNGQNSHNSNPKYPSAIAPAGKNSMNGELKIKFENAPNTMRLGETKSDKGFNLNTDVGYNGLPS